MKPQRKLTFVFDLYDFSESSEFARQVTLLFKVDGHRVVQYPLKMKHRSLKEFEDLAPWL